MTEHTIVSQRVHHQHARVGNAAGPALRSKLLGRAQAQLRAAALLLAVVLLLAACGSQPGTTSGSPGTTPGAANTPTSGGQPAGTITEFPLPSANSAPDGITAGPDGNLWFTESQIAKIGRITPGGQITEFPIPSNDLPYAITAGPDGNLWFTDCVGRGDCRGGGRIGRITPSGTITEFAVPTVAAWPESITPGPDGNLWFTECVFDSKGNCIDSKIGRITPSGNITEFCHLSENLARFSQITCPGLA